MLKNKGKGVRRQQETAQTPHQGRARTVATESLFLTCLINAMEHRKVATVDIPGAFMQADMEGDTVHMKLEEKMAELLTKLEPKIYRKNMTNKKGRTVLCVELKKSLYGPLQAALLFWRKLTPSLKERGFEINPYNWCVTNKTVNRKKITVVYHVYYPKISHKNGDTVYALIRKLSEQYRKEADLTIH